MKAGTSKTYSGPLALGVLLAGCVDLDRPEVTVLPDGNRTRDASASSSDVRATPPDDAIAPRTDLADMPAFDGNLPAPRDAAPDLAMNPTPDASCDQSLVGHWMLDEGSGTMAKDETCHGNDGQLVGFGSPPTWRTGCRKNGCLEFDGFMNRVEVPDSPSVDSIETGVTFAAWVYRTGDIDNGKHGGIVTRQIAGSNAEHYALFLNSDHRPTMFVRTGFICSTPEIIPPRTWVHLTVTFDGSSGRIYRNASLGCQASRTSDLRADMTPLMIGANENQTDGVEHFFPGFIDDVVVYNRVLSDQEISILSAGGRPPR